MFSSVRQCSGALLVLFVVTIAGGFFAQQVLIDGSARVPTIDQPVNFSTAAKQPQYDYHALRRLITYGRATLGDCRRVLTERDPAALANSLHALYAMRWQRGVVRMLEAVWRGDVEKYPDLAWDVLARPPARIALASTINRIQIVNTGEYQTYIRSFRNDPHEFNRAQVAVALGLNGDPEDIPYLTAMSDGDNHYVAQSAITALSLAGGNQARESLAELGKKHRGTRRGDLIDTLLKQAYGATPNGTR